MPNYIPHPDKPALDNGAITFVAEHQHAVMEYKLVRNTNLEGELPTLIELHGADAVDGWDAVEELEDLLSPVVYPTFADYRARRGWPLGAVLVAAGVDPELVSDAIDDDIEADEHWTEERGRYNFAVAPPGYVLRPLTPADVSPPVAALAGADGRIGWCFRSEGDGQTGQIIGDGDGFRLAHETAHMRAWQFFMADHTPKGYELFDTEDGWIWRSCDGEEVGPDGSAGAADEAAARAGAWAAFLADDALAVMDTLLLVDVWPEGSILDTSRTYPTTAEQFAAIAACDQIVADRVAWICGWTLLERGQAVLWAISEHLYASDNDDVERHPRPAHLDRNRPA